jgi:hypothetical protein
MVTLKLEPGQPSPLPTFESLGPSSRGCRDGIQLLKASLVQTMKRPRWPPGVRTRSHRPQPPDDVDTLMSSQQPRCLPRCQRELLCQGQTNGQNLVMMSSQWLMPWLSLPHLQSWQPPAEHSLHQTFASASDAPHVLPTTPKRQARNQGCRGQGDIKDVEEASHAALRYNSTNKPPHRPPWNALLSTTSASPSPSFNTSTLSICWTSFGAALPLHWRDVWESFARTRWCPCCVLALVCV